MFFVCLFSDLTLTFKDSVAYGAESGIVILKKIPKGQQQQKSKQKGEAPSESSTIPEFKPLNSDGSDEYSFKNIVGKFFHASTSLQPDNIAPTTTDDEIEVDVEALKKPPSDDVVYDELPPSKPSPSTFLANKKPNTFETINYETHPELYEDSKPEDEHSGSFKLSQKEIDLLKNYLIHLKSNTTKSNFNPNFPTYPREIKYGKPIEISASPPLFGGFKLNPPSSPFDEFKTNTIDNRYKRYPHRLSSKPKIRFAPRPSKHFPAQRQQPPVNLVKSVTYKLTPNGPIKVV